MKRGSWMTAGLALLAFGMVAIDTGEARGQWAEVSTVRYGLFGRPRSIETRLVPTVSVVPTTTVVSSGTIISEPVVATRYVQAVPTGSVIASRYVTYDPGLVPTTYVSRSYPVVSTGVITSAPVVRSYVPTTVRVLEPTVYILP
ncbi:hypothetical protein [Tautonia marina]|uniref:hypothetical protein n=1 Tax=Tautonia marina TaxID=2653855 RepID=UPI001260AC19|nr:hypothetical protein [Tautonia marina]